MSTLTLHTSEPVSISTQDIHGGVCAPFRVLKVSVVCNDGHRMTVDICCPIDSTPDIDLSAQQVVLRKEAA
jgi:hypothetical protein